jgi:hypothetical protein
MKRLLTILFLVFSYCAFAQPTSPDTVANMLKRQIIKMGPRGGSVDSFILEFSGTGGLGIPIGNTAQRPIVPTGWLVFRYNTDSLATEFGTDAQAWFKMAGGGAAGITTLAALTDVNISSPADGHMLVYRTSDNKWHNESVSITNAFVNGLNAFGANSTIGNSDNFALSIRTNNAARINITNAGAVSLPDGSLTVGGTTNGVINIQSSAGSTRGSIDLSSNNPRFNSATGSGLFGNAGATIGRFDSDKWFFGGGSVNTVSTVGIIAGTTSISPFQFNSGPLKTSKCVGCWGFLTDKIYFTITTGTAEKEVALWDATGTVGRIPFQTTNNRLLDDAGLSWDNSTKILQFSGTTSSFPGFIRDGAAVQVKLADNSGNANLKVLDQAYDPTTFDGNIEVPTKNAFRDEVESIRYKPYSQTASLVASTVDATPGNMSVLYGLLTLPNNSSGWVKITLVGNGQQGASTHNIHGIKYYSFHKSGGTLTLDAADVVVADKKGASVSTATWQLTISSNQPVLEVTGVSAITMNWGASVEITYVIEN